MKKLIILALAVMLPGCATYAVPVGVVRVEPAPVVVAAPVVWRPAPVVVQQPPVVVYRQPVVVQPQPVVVYRQPMVYTGPVYGGYGYRRPYYP